MFRKHCFKRVSLKLPEGINTPEKVGLTVTGNGNSSVWVPQLNHQHVCSKLLDITVIQIMPPRPNFQEKWLSNDLFRSWLARVQGSPTKAYCRVCHKMLSAEITSLKRHRNSRQHISLHDPNNSSTSDGSVASCSSERDGGPNTSSQDGLRGTPTWNDDTSLSEEKGLSGVAYATILFAVFLAEHNLPFR
ncbi:hypothetical protein Pmani_006630 [Petrolisthes manimaculis]|uniref:Uncharacterized protein n=1 Tax=Petrolisthes manimaculis TaxID=1843537 RepID=A0AAE1UFK0_9EUCA|nr:hypothetical protein Pmani_006630 [Petrolisthes manimaculis]